MALTHPWVLVCCKSEILAAHIHAHLLLVHLLQNHLIFRHKLLIDSGAACGLVSVETGLLVHVEVEGQYQQAVSKESHRKDVGRW